MFEANATILCEVSRKQWACLPKNSPVWVRLKATGSRLLRFIIVRNNLSAASAQLVLRLPFERGTVACPAADFIATHRGIAAYVL